MDFLYNIFKTINSDNISGLTDELKVLYTNKMKTLSDYLK